MLVVIRWSRSKLIVEVNGLRVCFVLQEIKAENKPALSCVFVVVTKLFNNVINVHGVHNCF